MFSVQVSKLPLVNQNTLLLTDSLSGWCNVIRLSYCPLAHVHIFSHYRFLLNIKYKIMTCFKDYLYEAIYYITVCTELCVRACIGCKRQYSLIICITVFEVAQLQLHYAEDFYVKYTSYYVTHVFWQTLDLSLLSYRNHLSYRSD